MKKVLNIAKNILVWALAAFSVFMMVFTVISVKTFDKYDKPLFGYFAYTVLTDSMSASGIDSGSIVFVKSVDPATLKPDDIITYQPRNLPTNVMDGGTTITHKIRRLTLDAEGKPGFVTYGTTTGVDDEAIVTYEWVVGKYQFHIPFIGSFFQFVKTTPGYISCIFIPFALLLLYNGANCVTLFRRYRKEQLADLQAEKDRLSAEREENAKVLAELRALKQQLAGGVAENIASPASAPAPTHVAAPQPMPQPSAPAQTLDAPSAQTATPRRVRTVRPVSADEEIKEVSAPTAPADNGPSASPEGDAPALRRPRVRRR